MTKLERYYEVLNNPNKYPLLSELDKASIDAKKDLNKLLARNKELEAKEKALMRLLNAWLTDSEIERLLNTPAAGGKEQP